MEKIFVNYDYYYKLCANIFIGGVSNTQQVPREDADIAEKSSPKPMRGRARGRPRGRPRGQSSHREVINDTGSNGIAEFLPQIRNVSYNLL